MMMMVLCVMMIVCIIVQLCIIVLCVTLTDNGEAAENGREANYPLRRRKNVCVVQAVSLMSIITHLMDWRRHYYVW